MLNCSFAINQALAVKLIYCWCKTNERVKDVAQLVADMKAGAVHTLLMSGVNPVYIS
jgi:hypothetical protein